MVYIKTYIFNFFYEQYLDLLTMDPRNGTAKCSCQGNGPLRITEASKRSARVGARRGTLGAPEGPDGACGACMYVPSGQEK